MKRREKKKGRKRKKTITWSIAAFARMVGSSYAVTLASPPTTFIV